MILRTLTLTLGLLGGAGASQFPEFAQQYTQRLGGTVDALEQVVADFDTSAAASGLTRAQALDQMTGTDFLDRRRTDMRATIARADRLSAALSDLERAGPFTRAYLAVGSTDGEVARETLAAYKPAVPLTFEGMTFALVGFLSMSLLGSVLLKALGRPRRARAEAGGRS